MADRGSTVGEGGVGLQLTQMLCSGIWLFGNGMIPRCYRELGARVAGFLSSIGAGRKSAIIALGGATVDRRGALFCGQVRGGVHGGFRFGGVYFEEEAQSLPLLVGGVGGNNFLIGRWAIALLKSANEM
jgi:hypothetical protein